VRVGTTRNARRIGVVTLVAMMISGVPQVAGAAPGPPSPPRSIRTTPGDGRAAVRWHAPDQLNGAPVVRYSVTAYDAHDLPLPTREFAGSQTSYTYPGLRNGKEYTFTVSARNKYGWSTPSHRSAPVRIGVPLRPSKPTATPGAGRATVSWHAPSANGAAVGAYRVTPLLGGHAAAARTFTSPATKQVVTGLKHGGRYTFIVAAHNTRGWGAASHPSTAIIVR
jgi:hypothetical protein